MDIDFGDIRIPGSGGIGAGSSRGESSRGNNRSSRVNPDDPAEIRDILMNDPHQLSLLKQNNPTLADALLSGDLSKSRQLL